LGDAENAGQQQALKERNGKESGMKSFIKSAAQGEISIRKIEALPESVSAMEKERGKWIIGKSETHHDHVLVSDAPKVFESTNPPAGMRVLYAVIEAASELIHERGHDTHETISFEPGIYEFRLGREYDPYAELARQVAD
jgi:hypothetical protein